EGEEHISFVKGHPAYAGDASDEPKDGGLEIEIQLTPREAGEHLALIADDLLRQGSYASNRAGRLEAFAEAARRHPDLAEVYEGLVDSAVIVEGPRNTYQPSDGEQLLADLKARYGRLAGGASVLAATSLRAVVNAIFDVVAANAERTGASAQQQWRQALENDADLRRAANF